MHDFATPTEEESDEGVVAAFEARLLEFDFHASANHHPRAPVRQGVV